MVIARSSPAGRATSEGAPENDRLEPANQGFASAQVWRRANEEAGPGFDAHTKTVMRITT
jgi:hypothetical protein